MEFQIVIVIVAIIFAYAIGHISGYLSRNRELEKEVLEMIKHFKKIEKEQYEKELNARLN